jgi:hypothetical protein
MEEIMIPAWLNDFCDPKGHREWHKKPFQVGEHVCASDTRTLVAVKGDGFDPIQHEQAWNAVEISTAIHGMLNVATPGECDAAALVDFCGPYQPPKTITCPECSGKGHKPHDCGCDLCEADEEECDTCENGKVTEISERFGIINGKMFQLNYLAKVFDRTKPEGKIAFAISDKITMRYGGIIAIVMGLDSIKPDVPVLTI